MADEPNINPAQTEESTATEDTNSSILTGDQTTSEETGTENTEQNAESSVDDEALEGEESNTGGDADGDDQTSPESYSDFTLPEGVELDVALMEKATPLFKELGLNQEQAQKLIDLQAEMVQEGARSQAETFSQLMSDWQEQARNDKEFGGDKFEESVTIARGAIDKFGTPELKQLMEDHMVGNHPEMIRFMYNVGKLTQEDVPGVPGGNVNEQKSRVDILYPKDK